MTDYTPLSDYLRVVEPTVDNRLIDHSTLTSIKTIAGHFPALVTSFYGFECVLTDDNPVADFLFVMNPESEITRRLLSSESNFWTNASFDDEWLRVRDMLNNFLAPASEAYRKSSNIWFEFDVPDTLVKLPLPGIFFSFERCQADKFIVLLGEVLPDIIGNKQWEEIRDSVGKNICLLNPSAHIFSTAVMISRPIQAVRFCIKDISADEILDYLKRCSYGGPLEEIERMFAIVAEQGARIILDIDIGKELFPRIGIEVSFREGDLPDTEPKWKDFLQFLTVKKLCTREKEEAMLTYPGYIMEPSDSSFWPENLLKVSSFVGKTRKSIFIKKLSHFKVVFDRGVPVQAKAYLAVRQMWRS